jgi:hypothetical protein
LRWTGGIRWRGVACFVLLVLLSQALIFLSFYVLNGFKWVDGVFVSVPAHSDSRPVAMLPSHLLRARPTSPYSSVGSVSCQL